ncbi:alcohol dehydrogenase [Mrakia frigida]|uniref:hydroxyacid-oxoacid transhydrogenase n=1 Tax=Mrakia frigida TaxID=29902 RepID=UPI003FCC1AE0
MRHTLPRLLYLPCSRSRIASPTQISSLIHHANKASTCPAHGSNCTSCSSSSTSPSSYTSQLNLVSGLRKMSSLGVGNRGDKEYAFEVSASNLRFGDGVTREVGMDLVNMGAKKVGVFTDATVARLEPMKVVIASLEENGIDYEVFDRCRVEPTDASWEEAIAWSRERDCSHFLAVGGGSVIDTTKAANLFSVYRDSPLLDFINAPVGKGLPVTRPLRPLIAIPTTAGTGSETTGAAIVDIPSLRFKTGIASRALRPTLGIVDSRNTKSCPRSVNMSAGLDVLFHALESYTAIPYDQRSPRPQNPIDRPAYQGRNPISDVFSLWALKTTVEMLPRVLQDEDDAEARKQMLLAATFAGVGFGTAGVHLCHAASYPISSHNKLGPQYTQKGGYEGLGAPIIPHGISVALSAPSVFAFTAPSSPDRHQEILDIFGSFSRNGASPTSSSVADGSLGARVRESVVEFLDSLGGMPRGLEGVGYGVGDLDALVEGMLPQKRVVNLAPNIAQQETEERRDQLKGILTDSLRW